jgi:predicted O-methyltransferase YrrM
MQGQLMPAERALLTEVVKQHKPKVCLEIGTWKGGGSTYSIFSGLQANGFGELYTCEIDPANFNEANELYKNNLQVHTLNCASYQLIEKLIVEGKQVDLAMFDGSEDSKENLDDFKMLDAHLKPGAIFMAHDWDLGLRVDGMVSTKSTLLRPYLESNSNWKILYTLTAPESVGLVCAQKIT